MQETQDQSNNNNNDKKNDFIPHLKSFIRETVELVVVTLFLLIVIRQGLIEARFIPSESMIPTLRIDDRLIIEKVTKNLNAIGFKLPIKRGDIIVFYPPAKGNGGKELKYDPFSLFARWTGLPFLPQDDAYIKRVIGLPGDEIKIIPGEGVYINGSLLVEPYINEVPYYRCTDLNDIPVYRLQGKHGKLIVPEGHLFVMGDNRNRSQDSHVWGFLDKKRIVGRAFVIVWRKLKQKPVLVNPPSFANY